MARVLAAVSRVTIVPAVALTLAWVTMTHIPDPSSVGVSVPVSDWVAHGAGYLVMAVCWTLTILPRLRTGPPAAAVIVWGAMATLGILDELTQPLFGRSAQLLDWVADAVGAAIGTGIIAMVMTCVGAGPGSRSCEQQVLNQIDDRVHVPEHHP